MAGIGNFFRGVRDTFQNMDPNTRAGLLSLTSGMATTPQMSRGLLANAESIRAQLAAEEERKARMAETAAGRQQRMAELDMTLGEQRRERKSREEQARLERESRVRESKADRVLRRQEAESLGQYQSRSLANDEAQARAAAAYRDAQIQQMMQREEMARKLDEQGNAMGAMMLRAGGKIDPFTIMMMGGMGGIGGMPMGAGSPQGGAPSMEDIIRAGAGNPSRG